MLTVLEEVIQIAQVAADKHAPHEARNKAMERLAFFFAGVDKVLRETAVMEYFDRCNAILSQCTRQAASKHFTARVHHETEETLEQWLAGTVIGVIEGRTMVVTLNGDRIRLMDYEIASMMRVYSLGYSFTLRCDLDKKEVIINSVRTRPGFI